MPIGFFRALSGWLGPSLGELAEGAGARREGDGFDDRRATMSFMMIKPQRFSKLLAAVASNPAQSCLIVLDRA
jgi:hypothetical protein